MTALYLLDFMRAVAVEGCPSNFRGTCVTPVVYKLLAFVLNNESAS